MQDFWKWFLDWWPSIVGACTTLVVALASTLAYRLSLRKKEAKIAVLNEELRLAAARATYTFCPHCGASIPLADLKWYLPGDLEDQDLNGVPDKQE